MYIFFSSLPTMSSGKDWWRTDDGSSTKWSFSRISYQGYLPWVLILNSWLTSNNSRRQSMCHFTTFTWFIESCICVFWRCRCIKVYLIWNWLVICNVFQSNPMKKIWHKFTFAKSQIHMRCFGSNVICYLCFLRLFCISFVGSIKYFLNPCIISSLYISSKSFSNSSSLKNNLKFKKITRKRSFRSMVIGKYSSFVAKIQQLIWTLTVNWLNFQVFKTKIISCESL